MNDVNSHVKVLLLIAKSFGYTRQVDHDEYIAGLISDTYIVQYT